MSQRISPEQLENMFIAKILREKPQPFNRGHLVAHVKSIGGKTINPDIDILQKIPDYDLAIGYEVKWLRYSEKGRISWSRLYRGIGQTLCYFVHGVTHAYLVLGWEKIPEEEITRILDYCQILRNAVISSGGLEPVSLPGRIKRLRSFINRCCGVIAFDVYSGKKYQINGDPVEVREEKFPLSSIEDSILRDEIDTKRKNLLASRLYFRFERNFESKWILKARRQIPQHLRY